LVVIETDQNIGHLCRRHKSMREGDIGCAKEAA